MSYLQMLRGVLAAFVLCLSAAMPSAAQAKGIVLFNTGSELFEVAEFPDAVKKDFPQAAKYKLGYKCKHFGVFWADIWTWDCEQVAVDQALQGYADLPADVKTLVAGRYSMSDAKRGFWNKYAFWGAIGVLIAGVALLLVLGGKGEDPREQAA